MDHMRACPADGSFSCFPATMPVSQEILPLGNIATAATFPRIYGRSISMWLPNFLGNLEAIQKYCRSSIRGPSAILGSFLWT